MTNHCLPAIIFTDTTLCGAAAAFSAPERRDIAEALGRTRVDEIELPAVQAYHSGSARPVLRAAMTRQAVHAARRAGAGTVHLRMPLSPWRSGSDSVIRRIGDVTAHAIASGLRAAVFAEACSAVSFELVSDAMAAAEAAGAHRFVFADTAGLLDPTTTHDLFRDLCAETDLELGFEGHGSFCRAMANTLAAIRGGATHVSAAMNAPFRDEGAACAAPLDTLARAIAHSAEHHSHIELACLPALAACVAQAARHHRQTCPAQQIDVVHRPAWHLGPLPSHVAAAE